MQKFRGSVRKSSVWWNSSDSWHMLELFFRTQFIGLILHHVFGSCDVELCDWKTDPRCSSKVFILVSWTKQHSNSAGETYLESRKQRSAVTRWPKLSAVNTSWVNINKRAAVACASTFPAQRRITKLCLHPRTESGRRRKTAVASALEMITNRFSLNSLFPGPPRVVNIWPFVRWKPQRLQNNSDFSGNGTFIFFQLCLEVEEWGWDVGMKQSHKRAWKLSKEAIKNNPNWNDTGAFNPPALTCFLFVFFNSCDKCMSARAAAACFTPPL